MKSAVVGASEGAMATLLEKLGDLLTDKYKLFKEAKEQIIFFKHELESMHVFLKKMSGVEEPDDQDKCWAKEIRELSYDIEDSVNEYLHHVDRESSSKTDGLKGFMDRIKNLWTTIMSRHDIAKELQGHKRRVIEVSERRTRYKDDDDVPKLSNTTIDPRVLAIYVGTPVLVGIEGPREEVIQLIDDEAVPADQLKVLSIVGFGGLGKTTLANQIYRKLEGQFNCRAFISVSQKPNIRKVLRTELSQVGFLDLARTMEWDENELITALRNFLLDKRYLIVIDDIWDVSSWEIISAALQENMNGSIVITTT